MTGTAGPSSFNLCTYAAEHAAELVPPVCNTMVHNSGPLRIMIVGGPNSRKDYHLNQGEELFYQLKGSMQLNVIENGNRARGILIKEGEWFVLPGRIPHSPQRFANTMGLVMERERLPDELDGLRYFVEDHDSSRTDSCSREAESQTRERVLWQRFAHMHNLGEQVKEMITQFHASSAYATGTPEVPLPRAPWLEDATVCCPTPTRLLDVVDGKGDAPHAAGLPNCLEVVRYGEFMVLSGRGPCDLSGTTSDETPGAELLRAVANRPCLVWCLSSREGTGPSEVFLGDGGVCVNDCVHLSHTHDMTYQIGGVQELRARDPSCVFIIVYTTAL